MSFWRQFSALFVKNWIVFLKRPLLNFIKAVFAPIAFGAFIAAAQYFISQPPRLGLGHPAPIRSLQSQYSPSLKFVWADVSNGTGFITGAQIMAKVTSDFTTKQLASVKEVATTTDIYRECPANFNGATECFAGVTFNSFPGPSNETADFIYTIAVDLSSLSKVDVKNNNGDAEKRVFPFQWALDQAIIELKTGTKVPTPLEWPFTISTNNEQQEQTRLQYISFIPELLSLAFFLTFIGIAYELPGRFASERANLSTSHMKAMGLRDAPRIISWLASYISAYLPAWVIVTIIWRFMLFPLTNFGILLVVNVLTGLSLASYSLFIAAPFGKSPQLAAVASLIFALVFQVLGMVFPKWSTGSATVFVLFFPPAFFPYAIRTVAEYEVLGLSTNVAHADPNFKLVLLPLVIVALINVFLWPIIAVLVERIFFDPTSSTSKWWHFGRRQRRNEEEIVACPPDMAISMRNLNKTFRPSWWKHNKVVGVEDLTLDIPKGGIFVLLGPNGAGKSTALSILGNLIGSTGGSVVFDGNTERPALGVIGIVPQKNVLLPELSCFQTLRLWREIKRSDTSDPNEDIVQLLRDCDLDLKIHASAGTLSGGQKRKLQLAIGLIGGSKIVLVDEATSGVDPLSRRALWRTLTSCREDRTIVLTTHFLDEADFLADTIAVLAAPGKLIAEGTPVALKRELGAGYSVLVSFVTPQSVEKIEDEHSADLLRLVHTIAPETYITNDTHQITYHLKSKDTAVVRQVLQLIETRKHELGVTAYDVHGSSIEEIFLDLMEKDEVKGDEASDSKSDVNSITRALPLLPTKPVLHLTDGRPRPPWLQSLTIFHKRLLVDRRSWLSLAVTVGVALAGTCAPLLLLPNPDNFSSSSVLTPDCSVNFDATYSEPLFLPVSNYRFGSYGNRPNVWTSPPNVTSVLQTRMDGVNTTNVADDSAFISTVTQNYLNQSTGGISLDLTSGNALLAYQAEAGAAGSSMLNLVSNILLNRNSTGAAPGVIASKFGVFPASPAWTNIYYLEWAIIFGIAMAGYPAFFALYVARERQSLVQSMQLSNGLGSSAGLWLGHLLHDSMFTVLISTVITIVYAVTPSVSFEFSGLGFLWLVMVLYGIAATLFAYCFSLFIATPMAAFAAAAAYQFVIALLYAVACVLNLGFTRSSAADRTLNILHFTLSLFAPVVSVMRASFVATNLFRLQCDGSTRVPASALGTILRNGGPILYLIGWCFALLGLLVWFDSGSIFRHNRKNIKPSHVVDADVVKADEAALGSDDILRVLGVSKAYGDNQVVDNISLGVARDTIFGLLGPNGAGKTTTFKLISGDVTPDQGDIFIDGTSAVSHPSVTRLSIGVCPQFTAIDSQLTVREHLVIYGCLKGLYRGEEVERNVNALLQATALDIFADRLASKLSGGNQRKLSLAIALIGNPDVILVDEFSTGVDAGMKRNLWHTLQSVSAGKAIVLTTHSMEEASAIATRVGIMAKRMLAIGTPDSLSARYGTYEVHFSCRTREELVEAQVLMAKIPGSRMVEDVSTRFQVPVGQDAGGMTLSQLFDILSTQSNFVEFTVEKTTLESVFLNVIRDNNFREEDAPVSKSKWRVC